MVTGDSDSAREEFERCQSTSSLTCYRAANVVIYFDAPPRRARRKGGGGDQGAGRRMTFAARSRRSRTAPAMIEPSTTATGNAYSA